MATKKKTAKSTTPRMVLVSGDNWEGIYIDGKLVDETHTLPAFLIMKAISEAFGISCSEVTPNPDWLNEVGNLPENLSDVKREKR